MTTRKGSEGGLFRDACFTSGSPPQEGLPTLHLLGVGKVGKAFLRCLPQRSYRLLCVTDSKASLYERGGLDPLWVLREKAEGKSLKGIAGSWEIETETAVSRVEADCVVDCTATDLDDPGRALRRTLSILESGRAVVLGAKDSLLADTGALLEPRFRGRLGIHALLGGTGWNLMEELDELRASCAEIVAVPNATTTLLVQSIEEGLDFEEATRRAGEEGLLEHDPAQDLEGKDAALKLSIVARAVFGSEVDFDAISRPSAGELDPGMLRGRRERGFTTRLVCRAKPGGTLHLGYEEIPLDSNLAIPWRNVAYGYRLRRGELRLHLGNGVGPAATAQALLEDLDRLFGRGNAHGPPPPPKRGS